MGISNWDIDASKQNRNLYLVRPDPNKNDLERTGISILSKGIENHSEFTREQQAILRNVVNTLSESYVGFREQQKSDFSHPNFHTLRDFYWLMKDLARLFNAGDEDPADDFAHRCVRLAIQSIHANFSGIYRRRCGQNEGDEGDPEREPTSSNHLFLSIFGKCMQNSRHLEKVNAAGTGTGKFEAVLRKLSLRNSRFLMLFVENLFTFKHLLNKLKA